MAVTLMANGVGAPATPWRQALLATCLLLGIGLLSGIGGCSRQPEQVIVYTALDENFSQPLLDRFSEQTGIEVLMKADTESTKTVGLANAILAERSRPRCDLFWNNEVLHTLRLASEGVLQPLDVAEASHYPAEFRASDGTWYGFAARARVLLVNINQISEARRPKSISALTDPQWRDKCAIAKPLAGTTATHAACLFAEWGDDEARQFFTRVKANAQILSGNRDVARRVASGALAFGLTDTDDAMVEIDAGAPVAIVYPDQREGELGTLFIPNTLAAIQGSANGENAKRLIEYLLQPDTEGLLVRGPSAQIPLHASSEAKPRVETPATVRAMQVDFEAAAGKWDAAYEFLRDEFAAAK